MTLLELYLALHKIVHSEKSNTELLSSEIEIEIPTELSRSEDGHGICYSEWRRFPLYINKFRKEKFEFSSSLELDNYLLTLREQNEEQLEIEIARREREEKIEEIKEEIINTKGRTPEI
jgi:hypothetical protein